MPSFYWHRPLAVAEPFGVGVMLRIELVEVAAAAGARFSLGALAAVDTEQGCARSASGAVFEYEALVVASGARPVQAVPGALGFRGPADVDRFRGLLAELEAGVVGRLAFVLPAGVVWPLPLYELALLTAAYREGHSLKPVELSVVTPEDEPLQVFGADASSAVRELLEERGIEFCGGSEPVAFEDGAVVTAAGVELVADRAVALPRLTGPALEGLPHDTDGFIVVDQHGRVAGVEGAYAAGDVTSFPVKQGGLAAQQADAVAETIAAAAGAPVRPHPFRPVLRGLLLTGGIPRYLRTPLTGADGGEAVSVEPLWWPPAKIAARRLGPFLAGAGRGATSGAEAIPVELDFDDRLGESVVAPDAGGEPAADARGETTHEQARPVDLET